MDQPNPTPKSLFTKSRILVLSIVGILVLFGLVLVLRLTAAPPGPAETQRVDALANSTDECVSCHRQASPGIVQQYGHSSMAGAKVSCQDCHEVKANYPGAVEHEGTYVLQSPSTAMCERCHQSEVAQFNASRHGLPAYVAVVGSKELTPELLAAYQAIPEGLFAPDKSRNILAEMEGKDITRFACETCHNVGRPAPDGSVGECQSCHLRHEFSLEQARKPETCNACHIGPDHPQWEIYQESPHGIAYATMGYNWNWDADPGTLSVQDMPAPTCATCHFSSFGGTATTHDAGDRLSWYLFAPISERRPGWQDNAVRMQTVCLECHNKNFIASFYTDADKLVLRVNELVEEGNAVVKPLRDAKLITDVQFDEMIEFANYELWHHWGRTTKFGAWMQGPDYTQWHGAYEMVKVIAELRAEAKEIQISQEK